MLPRHRHTMWCVPTMVMLVVSVCMSVNAGGDDVVINTYTTPLADVTTSFTTFAAQKHPSQGHHRGSMSLTVPIGDSEIQIVTSPDKMLFAPTATFHAHDENGIETVQLDKDLFHFGQIVGDPDSQVHINVHPTGAVEGTIHRSDGSMYILDALARYPPTDTADINHDTAIYERNSLTAKALHGLYDHSTMGCPVQGVSAEQTNNPVAASGMLRGVNLSSIAVKRTRRASDNDAIHCLDTDDKKCSCDVGLVGDFDFFIGPNCNRNVNYGIQMMISQVVGANRIYRSTNFAGMTGLGFLVQSAHVFKSRHAPGNPTPYTTYSNGAAFLGAVTNGLARNFTDVCSSILFTHRDFHEGILGMAWVASSSGFGGICDPKFNCGFNTGINFGVEITPFVASLVFAHEIGHNCGAEHDPDTIYCSPADDDDGAGKYIMFAAATDGTKPNNHKFSPCSEASMGHVMQFLRSACFIEAGIDECGNGIIDGDEECDCGDQCTPTSCCTKDCKVKTTDGFECSPQNALRYPCCTTDCHFKSAGVVCHEDDECAEDAVCNGTSATCPLQPKEDFAACHCTGNDCTSYPGTNPQVCVDGVCDDYVCSLYGAKQCGLPFPDFCKLGCIGPGFGDGETCLSTFHTSKAPDGFGGGRMLFPGTPCMQNMGICDNLGTCKRMDMNDAPRSTDLLHVITHDYWQESLVVVSAIFLIAALIYQYRSRKVEMEKRIETERAYLLTAANEEFERSEERRVLVDINEMDDCVGEEFTDDGYAGAGFLDK